MAVTSYQPLVDRVYEVLVDGAGTARTLPSGSRFAVGSYPGQAPQVTSTKAHEQANGKVVYVAVTKDAPHVAPELHSVCQYTVTVVVIADYFCEPEQDLDAWRDTVALVAFDRHLVRAALGYPGNLVQTAAAAATGLSGGCLHYKGGSTSDISAANRVVRSTMTFEGTVSVTQPT